MISSEVEELIGMCDRILVMRPGKFETRSSRGNSIVNASCAPRSIE